jgi:hypothetical protein
METTENMTITQQKKAELGALSSTSTSASANMNFSTGQPVRKKCLTASDAPPAASFL